MLNTINSASQSLSPAMVPAANRSTSPIAWLLDHPSAVPTEEQLADITARLGRGLPGTPVITKLKNSPEEGIHIRFCLTAPSKTSPGRELEFLVCKIDLKRTRGNIDAIRVTDEEHQKPQGLGKTFTRNLFTEAIESGVPGFGLRSEKVGSYLWLKCGFEVNADSRLSPKTYMIEKELSAADKNRLAEIVRAKDHWAMADFTADHKKHGYALTYDTEWSGAIDFTNPKHVERMNKYLGMDAEPIRNTSPVAKSGFALRHN